MTNITTLKDDIELGIKAFVEEKGKRPTYIVLGRDTYLLLKTIHDIPPDEEIPVYAGYMVHIKPTEENLIEFI